MNHLTNQSQYDTEEKARRYDLAIEAAKRIYKNMEEGYNFGGMEDLEVIFPELKESEDERIRKEIISHLQYLAKYCQESIPNVDKWIDWLEKQGEKNLPDEHIWLYIVDDVLTWKNGIGQYLDNPEVQEIAKKLCNKYAQKLYNLSVK